MFKKLLAVSGAATALALSAIPAGAVFGFSGAFGLSWVSAVTGRCGTFFTGMMPFIGNCFCNCGCGCGGPGGGFW
jgi:hypothetical protein